MSTSWSDGAGQMSAEPADKRQRLGASLLMPPTLQTNISENKFQTLMSQTLPG